MNSNENNNQLKKMTTAFGAPVANDDDIKTAGKTWPIHAMEDVRSLEKMGSTLIENVIPERRMHAERLWCIWYVYCNK